jgi:pyridoxamine 5'-phosphate oxidase
MARDTAEIPESLRKALDDSPVLPTPLPAEPFALFCAWFDEACRARLVPNPESMSLATVDPDGTPSNRIVLCRAINGVEGYVTFFTNYESRKGVALSTNPRAAATFHWDHHDRQARLEGIAVRSPASESDEYFRSRIWESRISAWASAQSRPLSSRTELGERVRAVLRRFGVTPESVREAWVKIPIPRPPHWGGYRLYASRVELWLGGAGRLHDRAEWTRELRLKPDGSVESGPWSARRLQP